MRGFVSVVDFKIYANRCIRIQTVRCCVRTDGGAPAGEKTCARVPLFFQTGSVSFKGSTISSFLHHKRRIWQPSLTDVRISPAASRFREVSP